MLRFKSYLIEDYNVQILILEGKGQHQIIKDYGAKILDLMQRDHGRLGQSGQLPGTAHYAKFHQEPSHGTTQHIHDYIMKHMGIPETPSYLNIKNSEDANTWNQHLNWILTRYAKGDQSNNSGIQRLEDIQHRAIPSLARYHGLVKKGKMNAVSLGKWKNLTDMETAIQKADPLDAGNLDPSEYTVHDSNEHWDLVTPHTAKAACSLGHGTHWCTTNGAFEEYSDKGPLYIMIPKNAKHKGEKYQLHLETNQLMDKEDSPVSASNMVLNGRPATPKMSAILKAHGNYDDEGRLNQNAVPLTKEENDFIFQNHPGHAYKTLGAKGLTREQTQKILQYNSPLSGEEKTYLLRMTPHLDKEMITHILLNNKNNYSNKNEQKSKYSQDIIRSLFSTTHSNKIETEHAEILARSQYPSDLEIVASHPKLSPQTLEKLHGGEHPFQVRRAAAQNPNTTTEQLEKYIRQYVEPDKLYGNATLANVVNHPNFSKERLKNILDTEIPQSRETPSLIKVHLNALQNPNIDQKHLDQVAEGTHPILKHDVTKGGSHRDVIAEAMRMVVNHPNATDEHLIKIMNAAPINPSTSSGTKVNRHDFTYDVLENKNITPEVLHAAIKNVPLGNAGSIQEIQKHSLYSPEHESALFDRLQKELPESTVRDYFKRKHPVVTPQQY